MADAASARRVARRPPGTWRCWVATCAQHAVARETERGLPVAWLRVQVGLPEGRGFFMEFCGLPCLRAAIARSPKSFLVVPDARRRAGGAG